MKGQVMYTKKIFSNKKIEKKGFVKLKCFFCVKIKQSVGKVKQKSPFK